MHVLRLPLFALPAQAQESALPRTHVDGSVPIGFCRVAPAVLAGLNRAKAHT